MTTDTHKKSYTVSCSSAFRDTVIALAEAHGGNVADLARAMLMAVPRAAIEAHPDPGDAPAGDRETVVLQSGASKGKPWRRKPRLQVRLAPGFDISIIRRALALALAIADNTREIRIIDPLHHKEQTRKEKEQHKQKTRSIVDALAFQPVVGNVTTREEALYIMGFPPHSRPNTKEIRARFRTLAAVLHPDAAFGDHRRMSQLNEAMSILKYR